MRRAFLLWLAAGVLVGATTARGEQATGRRGDGATQGRATGLQGDGATHGRATGLRGDEATGEEQVRPVVRRAAPRRGFGVFATFDQTTLEASRTFDAVTGQHRQTSFGAGVEATNIVSRVFARVAFSRASVDGERVFIIDGEPLRLGIPLEVEMTPIEIAGGWRQPFGRRGRAAGYGGAGLLLLGYRETSRFGDDADNTDERFTGYLVFGGVDVNLYKGLTAGFEAQYRSVADAIGQAGVSQAFGETNLGGVVVRVLVGFRR